MRAANIHGLSSASRIGRDTANRCIPQGEHYQQRDRLRLIVDYRRKFLDSLVRGGEEEAKQAENHYEQAKAQLKTVKRN